MKKLIGLYVLVATAAGAFAQEPAVPEEKVTPGEVVQPSGLVKEGIIFKNGKPWLIKDGQTTLLEEKMTMGNGMTVFPTGMLVMPNGEKAMLIEQDFVYMDGAVERIIPVKSVEDNKPTPGGG